MLLLLGDRVILLAWDKNCKFCRDPLARGGGWGKNQVVLNGFPFSTV